MLALLIHLRDVKAHYDLHEFYEFIEFGRVHDWTCPTHLRDKLQEGNNGVDPLTVMRFATPNECEEALIRYEETYTGLVLTSMVGHEKLMTAIKGPAAE